MGGGGQQLPEEVLHHLLGRKRGKNDRRDRMDRAEPQSLWLDGAWNLMMEKTTVSRFRAAGETSATLRTPPAPTRGAQAEEVWTERKESFWCGSEHFCSTVKSLCGSVERALPALWELLGEALVTSDLLSCSQT